MNRMLHVAEKPAAAREIANILSRRGASQRQTEAKFTRCYDFTDGELVPGWTEHTVTSVAGHIMNFDFPPEMRKWNMEEIPMLFSVPVRKTVGKDAKDLVEVLKKETRKCGALVLWLDGDREGENISFEVIEVCCAVKKDLKILQTET